MLTKLVVIILQCMHLSNHFVIHLKLIQFLYQLYLIKTRSKDVKQPKVVLFTMLITPHPYHTLLIGSEHLENDCLFHHITIISCFSEV